tara:strand:+ start:184 stop:1227 length:1044 start_codon:yes stop_codon:yes gene_type:complete
MALSARALSNPHHTPYLGIEFFMSAIFSQKWIGFTIKALLTLGLIWLVLSNQDLGRLSERLYSMTFWSIALALVLLFFQAILAAVRWFIVMRLFGKVLPFQTVLRFYFEALLFNQALPSTIGGDGVRMYRAVKAGLSVEAGINGVLLDRIAGLFALLAIVLVTQPWLYDRVDETAARLTFGVVIAVGLAVVAVLSLCERLPSALMKWRLMRGLSGLSAQLNTLFTFPATGILVFGLSILGHLLMVTASYVLACDLELGVTFVDCLVIVPGVILLAAAPISIAGWGVREVVMVAAMSLLDVPHEGSTSLSLVFGALMAGIGLVGGVLWLANPDRRAAISRPLDKQDLR